MGLLLLVVSLLLGYILLKEFFKIKKIAIVLSGSFLIGILLSGTILYLLDLLFIFIFHSYSTGMIVFSASALIFILFKIRYGGIWKELKSDCRELCNNKAVWVALICFLIFSGWLNYHTFNNYAGDIRVAGGAWSDIIYHHAYVRTVSIGNNVPTQYPYFANEPIRYHFLFDYYTGKIAQAGMNTVHALNLMSALSLTVLLLLIFEFGKTYFKSTAVGVLGAVFLIFHSSIAAFTWLKENMGLDLGTQIATKTGWLNGAQFESWGLFNLNVFINQRHFAFALASFVFFVLCLLIRRKRSATDNGSNLNPTSMKENILVGILIGCLPFWNAVITGITLACYSMFAVVHFKNKKFAFGTIYTVIIATLIIIPQFCIFKSGQTVLADYPRFHLGYALDRFSLSQFFLYYYKVLGLKAIAILAAFLIIPRPKKFDMLILTLPFLIANVIQFGYILYDNNKLIIASLVFLNCYAAYSIVWLYQKVSFFKYSLTGLLIVAMILAGTLDLCSVKNMGMVTIADQSSALKQWIISSTKPDTVFLTASFIPYEDNAMVAINLAGRKLYAVRNDVDSSCFVDDRLRNITRLYAMEEGLTVLKDMLSKEKVDYIVVDGLVRENGEYRLDETKIADNFKLVFQTGTTKIYTTGG